MPAAPLVAGAIRSVPEEDEDEAGEEEAANVGMSSTDTDELESENSLW